MMDLVSAIHTKNARAVQEIVKNKDLVNMPINSKGLTPLMLALTVNYPIVINILLNNGADPSQKNIEGKNALFFTENPTFIRQLGLDLGSKDNMGRTAICAIDALFMEGAAKGSLKTLKMSVEAGANISQTNRNGNNGLMKAAMGGHYKAVEFLIGLGVDVNAQNKDLGTALMLACEYGHLEIVKLLIDSGVDINEKNAKGETAYDIAIECKRTGIINYLKLGEQKYYDICKTDYKDLNFV